MTNTWSFVGRPRASAKQAAPQKNKGPASLPGLIALWRLKNSEDFQWSTIFSENRGPLFRIVL
jgi:hypothetical protein